MSSPDTRNIIFVHPAIQDYRTELFDLLSSRLDVQFVFLGFVDHNRAHLPTTNIRRWSILDDSSLGPYRQGVSGKLLGLAASGDYDIWIGSILNSFATHWTWPIVKARRRKFLLWAEDWWWPAGLEGYLSKLYGRRVIRGADGFIVAGSRARAFFLANGARPEQIEVATNACRLLSPPDPCQVALLRTRWHAENRFVFLYLNRIVDYKGLDVLLRAFPAVSAAVRNALLIVVGDGPQREANQQLAANLELDNVRFVGQVERMEVAAAYAVADVYVHPASWGSGRVKAEAWGFTVNEAMSLGRPVLATTSVAASDDLIEEGVTGRIVAAGNEQALAAAMIDLAHDPALRAMGIQAARRMRDRFTPYHQFLGFSAAIARAAGAVPAPSSAADR